MYEFSRVARELELSGMTRDEVGMVLQPIRVLMGVSRLVSRLQTWPRGYPGDFETIEQIASGVNTSDAGTWSYYLEQAVLHSGAVRQHQNKLKRQTLAIRQTLDRVGKNCTILSIGCGGCRDLLDILPALNDFTGMIVLNDIDPSALELAQKRVSTVTGNFRLLHCNALKAIRRLEDQISFDLVIAGGLFDYLSDKAIISILKTIFGKLLKPRGEMLFTNIAAQNPYRTWMEYAADWKLIERSEEQTFQLCEAAGIPLGHTRITRDETGLTLLAGVIRA